MENAAKALIIAGGVLIAIIIIAALVKIANTVGSFQKSNLTEEEQRQLVEFNEQYTKYLRKYVYGTDVITVVNKALDNTDCKITVNLKFVKAYSYGTYIINKDDEISIQYPINDEKINEFVDAIVKDDFKNRAFKCTGIDYDSYGRVNTIKFEEKEWGDLT